MSVRERLVEYDYAPTPAGWWRYHRDLCSNEGHALYVRWFHGDRLQVGFYLDIANPRLSFELDRKGFALAVWPFAFGLGATS